MFHDNKEARRFERDVKGAVIYAAYRLDGDVLSITYVEAPQALRGSGEAGKLMEDIMTYARENKLKVIPICAYAVSWLRRNQSYKDVLV